jgi:hypothetical protein
MKYWLRDLVYHTTIVPRMKWLQHQLPDVKIFPFGSRYVCNPPTMDTDIDFLVYSKNNITSKLERLGYKLRDYYYGNRPGAGRWKFTSWRKGKVNLVVSSSKELIEVDVIAAHICRRYNIRHKDGRIIVHEAMRGSYHQEAEIGFNILYPEVAELLSKLCGTNGNTMIKAYKAIHNVSVLL